MAKTRKLHSGLKAWNIHWKKVREEMKKKGTFKKGDNLTSVFKEAKKTFKSHKKGGADETLPAESSAVEPAKESESSVSAPTGGKRKTKKRRPSSRK